MASVDYVVMGRRTFEVMLKFTKDSWYYSKPVFVLTHRPPPDLPAIVRDKAIEFGSHTPRDLVAMLGKRGARRLYVDGGQVIQAFMREDLIDELTLTRVNVIIGEGIPLFGSLPRDVKVAIERSFVLSGGAAVQTVYRVVRR